MNIGAIRIIGIDPGLRHMGWGVIEATGSRLAFLACGSVRSSPRSSLAERLCELHQGLLGVIRAHSPSEAAVEETFVNCDPQSALKLGQARIRGQDYRLNHRYAPRRRAAAHVERAAVISTGA